MPIFGLKRIILNKNLLILNPMKITKNIEIIDLALYIKKENVLIIADTHIGYEESLNKQGILIPRFQFKETIIRLERIIKTTTKRNKKLSKIIINGDIKDEFGTISEQEWRHTLKLLDFLSRYCDEVILIKGNHDTIIGPIAKKRKVKVLDSYELENILILHGHKIPKKIDKKIKTIIIAHEHPAVSLKDGIKTEVCKCFLKGTYKRKNLIVIPQFNILTEGIDILHGKRLSPFLKQDLKNFDIFIVADKVYDFGKMKNLTRKFHKSSKL